MIKLRIKFVLMVLLSTVLLSACSSDRNTVKQDGLQILATTTIVGDVVKHVAGDKTEIHVLLPVGASPHSFEANPRDVAMLSRADIVFVNGLGLETFLEEMIISAGVETRVVSLSDSIKPLKMSDAGHSHGKEGRNDPHVWTNPRNIILWTNTIYKTLSHADSLHSNDYAVNKDEYIAELERLDQWIDSMVTTIPAEKRKLITDHLMFGYFCERYGFEQSGAIIPSFSSLAEPSARELAKLEDLISEKGIKAVFIGKTVNPRLAKQLARDTGISLVKIYTGSLGGQDSGAETYIDYMKYNVMHIVEALGSNGID